MVMAWCGFVVSYFFVVVVMGIRKTCVSRCCTEGGKGGGGGERPFDCMFPLSVFVSDFFFSFSPRGSVRFACRRGNG